MRHILAAICVVCLGSTGARADMTGNDLKSFCTSNDHAAMNSGVCAGYIVGTSDAIRMTDEVFKRNTICGPPEVTVQQVVAIAKKYLEDHPELLNYRASSLVGTALIEAFPCGLK